MKNSEAIIGAYDVAKRIRDGSLTRTAGIEDLHQRFGMNRSSASGAFTNIAHMLKGEPYKRTMNALETEHFLQMIHRDYGTDGLRKAIASVEKHIRYYEGLPRGSKLLNIWQIVHKYRDIARDQREPVAVDIPPAVRLLPMNPEEPEFRGKSRDAVQQDFFLDTMPLAPNPGRYQYRERGLDAEPGTVVLFQFKAHIIASAVLVRKERYREPAGPYNGALWFDPGSIRVFSSIGADSVRKHWSEKFTEFGQGMQKLEPPSRYPAFEQELSGIQWAASPAPQARDLEAPPAARVQTTVSRIVRDTQLTNRVKAMHSYKCQICGHTILLADGTRYAEGHHVQPLGEPHNGPDVTENIICLCPNHHAACDLGAIRLDLAQLRKATGHCVSRRYIDYHNETICRVLNA